MIARSRINKKKDFYYFDLTRDDIKDYIEGIKKKWKLLVIVPVSGKKLDTVLYLISTKKSSFKTRNITSLKTFLSFLKIIRSE